MRQLTRKNNDHSNQIGVFNQEDLYDLPSTKLKYGVKEFTLAYTTKGRSQRAPYINASDTAYNIFWQSWNMDTIELTEDFKVIFMNRANKVLGIMHVSSGSITGCVVDIKKILVTALHCMASAIIVAHNHPSGNIKPSQQDLHLTKKLKEACTLVEINLIDHIILTPQEGIYRSFTEEGEL